MRLSFLLLFISWILDIIKEMPDFIVPENNPPYKYTYTGKNHIDNRLVHIISFRQKDHVREPLYCGELFIEDDNKALVEARIAIIPKLINKATHSFIDKKPLGLQMTLQEAAYIVSYKPSNNGFYYASHVRGDIRFKIRRKNRLFTSSLHFWFEMATCEIDTCEVKTFPPNERLSATRIFAETKSVYDKNFWEHFNVILPEEDLKNAIMHNLREALVTKQE